MAVFQESSTHRYPQSGTLVPVRTPQKLKTQAGETYYRVRYRRDGKQRSLTCYGPTAREDAEEFARLLDLWGADRAWAHWNAHLEPGPHALTLDAWFDRHLAAMTNVTEGTRLTYRRTYDRVWSKPLGSLPLDAVTREHIAHVINELAATKSDKTVKNAYGVLATAFKVAVADGHLPETPCKRIALPRRTEHEATEMRFLTYDEWAQLYDALPAHYRPLFTFLVGTGCRWGEVEALQVRDVELIPTPVVRVTKAAKWNASKATREIGPTKTPESRRTVTLPPEVVAAIAPLLDGRKRTERLFLAPRGGELRHRTVYDEWRKAVERSGLEEPFPRIHDLRHTHVAWLIAAGIPLPVIKARLGHKEIATTIDRYGHLLPDLQHQAAAAAQAVMAGLSSRAAIES